MARDVDGAAVGERLHGAAEVVAVVGRHLLVAVERGREHVGDVGRRQRRQVHHLEARRGVAQQPMRARDVAAWSARSGSGCRPAPSSRSRSTWRRPGKLSNVRSSSTSSSRNVHGSPPGARAVSKNASSASNASRAVAGAGSARVPRERRRRRSPPGETARVWWRTARRRCTARRCGRAARAAAAAARCGRCRIRRARPESVKGTRRARHEPAVRTQALDPSFRYSRLPLLHSMCPPRVIGILMPSRLAVAIAPRDSRRRHAARRRCQDRRSARARAVRRRRRVPSATITMPACSE